MSIRSKRVAGLIQREVALILQQEYAERLTPMVTITDARMTKDLSIAYVYASVMGDTKAERKATFKQLEALSAEVRSTLASRIRHQLRTVPEVRFFLDESMQRAKRMETLFDRIRAEREHRLSDPDEPDTE